MKKFANKKGLIFILVMLIIFVGAFSLKINKQYTNNLKTKLSQADVQEQNVEQSTNENAKSASESTNTSADENIEKLYDIQIELNKLGTAKNNNIAGALFKISNNNQDENINLNIYNKKTGEKIEANEQENVQIPEEGAIIDASNIKKGHVYEIKIEEIQAPDGYKKILENAVIQISVDENENVIGKVKSVNSQTAQDNGTISAEDSEGSKKGVIEFTNENEEGKSIIKKENSDLGLQYKLGEDGTWTNYTGDLQIQENTTVYARATDGNNYSGVSLKVINNIDKVPPTVVSIKEKENNDDIETSVDINITDDASGIIGYGISKSNTEEPSYTKVNQELSVQTTIGEISENGTYYLWVKDAATNVTIKEFEVTGVKHITVAKIIAASEGNEALINTEYYTLKEALEAVPAGATATIQIIHAIYDESNVIENRNITLDLNGFLVQSRSKQSPNITVNTGNLTILNSKIQGGLTSVNTQAIIINSEGTLTLGKDDRRISLKQPFLKGKDFGVKNDGGTFNFFDGSVTATSAIFGKVTQTPVAYSVAVVDGKEDQTASLAIISGIEARIGRKTYTKLEDAIADAGTKYGTDGSQVEIVLVNDIAKSETVVIDKTKNIKLDLDGHVLTTTSTGYVIENYGKLEIDDGSSYGGNYSYKIEAEKSNIVSGNKNWSSSSFSGGFGVDNAKDLNFDFEVTNPGTYVLTVAGSYFSRTSDIFLDGSTESIYNFASDGNNDNYMIKDIVIENLTAGKHNIRFYNNTDGYSPIYDYFKISNNKGLGKITSTTNNVILNGSTDDIIGDAEQFDLNNIKKFNEDDQYYFKYNIAEGHLVNTNNTHANSLNTTATGYLPVDLTDKEGTYKLTVNAEISANYYGYVSITNEPDNSSKISDSSYGMFIGINRRQANKNYSINLAGGQKYYLNFRYSKNNSNSVNYDDEFRINSVKIEKKLIGKLVLTNGTVEIDKEGTYSNYFSCINNFGIFEMNGGIITGNKYYNSGVITKDGALTNINNGDIEMTNTQYGYGVWANKLGGLTKINGGNIQGRSCVYMNGTLANVVMSGGNLSDNSTNQILIDGRMSKLLLNNVELKKVSSEYTIYASGYFNNINIENCVLNNINSKAIYIRGNEISFRINNSRISTEREFVCATPNNYSNYKMNLSIENSQIEVNSNYCIMDLSYQYKTINIINSTLQNTKSTSNNTAINMIYGGTFNISGNTTINSNGPIIKSDSYDETTINVKSGSLTSINSQVINMPYARGTITLGEKDGNVHTTPTLKSSKTAWTIDASNMNLNFYDGKLIGDVNKIVKIPIQDIEDEKEIISNINDESFEELTLETPQEYVAEVVGKNKYTTLQQAIDSCTTEEKETIKLLKNINTGRAINISEGQNIIIDTYEKSINMLASTGIINNGNLELKNTNENVFNMDINELTNNGEYYFVKENDDWISNNKGKHNTTAHSYAEIDLTNQLGEYEITVNAEISSEGADPGYITVTDSTIAPEYSQTTNRFVYISGIVTAKDYTYKLQGGKKYYIHFDYKKDGSVNTGKDCFIIHKINVKALVNGIILSSGNSLLSNNGTATIADNNVSLNLYTQGKDNKTCKFVIQNKGKLNISSGKMISTGRYAENIDNEGDVRIEGGELITKSNAYGVYNKGTVKMIGGKITLTDTSSYYGDSYGIYNDNEGKVEITGGEIETGYGYGVYNNTGTVELGDAKIKKYGVFNNAGTINITGGEINVSSHRNGVTNWSKGTINISGGKIITSADGSSGVYNEGTINMTGGEITTKGGYNSGDANGIENYKGTVNIKEGTITTLKSERN